MMWLIIHHLSTNSLQKPIFFQLFYLEGRNMVTVLAFASSPIVLDIGEEVNKENCNCECQDHAKNKNSMR